MSARSPEVAGGASTTGGPGRDPLPVRAVVRAYPRHWRDRYGEEFASLLSDLALTASWRTRAHLFANAAVGALDARLHPRKGTKMLRIRGSVATVACCLVAFAIAVAGFAKMREDPPFTAAARDHAAVAASLGTLWAAAVLAAVTVLVGALPLGWSVLSQTVTQRRGDLARPLVLGPAAVTAWVIGVVIIARVMSGPPSQPRVHATVNLAVVAAIGVAGAAAALACAWAAIAVLRRADLAPGLLRFQVAPMAVLSVCMAVVTGADVSWGLALRTADPGLFHGDNGLVATPLIPSWAAGVAVLAVVTALTVVATLRAARELRAPAH